MNPPHTHQSLSLAIRNRITAGEWPPGTVMPSETDLAQEYQCARATMNRALQVLADSGLIERKRRAGTRVMPLPSSLAKIEIPIIRHEIEKRGAAFGHSILMRETAPAPEQVARQLHLRKGTRALHLKTLYQSDQEPFAYEDRWVNIQAVPAISTAPLDEVSPNEWLVRDVPYSSGYVSFSASAAGSEEAAALGTRPGAALFTVSRTTWLANRFITTVTLSYRPGYQLQTKL